MGGCMWLNADSGGCFALCAPSSLSLPPVVLHSLHTAHKQTATATYDGEPVALKIFLSEVSPDGKAQDEVSISCRLDHPNLTRVKALVFDRRDKWPIPDEEEGEEAPYGNGANGAAAAAAASGTNGGGGGAAKKGAVTAAVAAAAAAAGGGERHAHEAVRGLVLELVEGKPLAAKPTSEHLLRCK